MENKKLNPNVPADAVNIVDILTKNVNLNLSRAEVGLFNQAVHTLQFFFQNPVGKDNVKETKMESVTSVKKTPQTKES